MFPIAVSRPPCAALLVASALALAALPARAAVTTFAQFVQNGAHSFSCLDNATDGALNGRSILLQFDCLNTVDLPADFRGGNQADMLTLASGASSDALSLNGPGVEISGGSNGAAPAGNSIIIIRDGMTVEYAHERVVPPRVDHAEAALAGDHDANSASMVVPEADARLTLGFFVGLIGLGELLRRFRGSWASSGREELEAI